MALQIAAVLLLAISAQAAARPYDPFWDQVSFNDVDKKLPAKQFYDKLHQADASWWSKWKKQFDQNFKPMTAEEAIRRFGHPEQGENLQGTGDDLISGYDVPVLPSHPFLMKPGYDWRGNPSMAPSTPHLRPQIAKSFLRRDRHVQ